MIAADTFSVTREDAQAIDDCWNRIGIHGDKSCPLLVDHIHCRNCSVYSAAATRLLDRYALQQEDRVQVADTVEEEVKTRSLLMFRLGEEWLGLATRSLVEVAPQQAIHSLPHQRSRALLGVANVRGALVACLSLSELLGLESGGGGAAPGARVMPRMLIIAAHGGPVVVPVDEVDGIHAIDERLLDAASRSGTHADAKYTRGVLQFRGRSLRWLDEEQLLSAVTRSLT
ncbi:chemotaxis protein CheW [Pseudomonas sp. C1C7]|uniref:chemotaxis protein CheW n=1 Tax=Pseudomonas sp. C1C7 TaxID=2735272 RepID=UPI001585DE94|nr:chemotaxis protein CheW [Pseudomonas sp. C1C7]NUT73615.1 chemotaxis protein CheW [Pseudomonas sp. C1C7]